MVLQIDPEVMRDRLEARLGIRLLSSKEHVDGGVFPALRPFDLEPGHGFCVALARTPRQVMASFHLDAFAGRLLRIMWEADETARKKFSSMAKAVQVSGATVHVEIDGRATTDAFESQLPWRALNIEVSRRLGTKVTGDALHDGAIEAASSCLALALSLVPMEEIGDLREEAGLPEGAKTRVEVNRYERTPANRAACIAFFGTICKGCGFDFRAFYGPLAEGYIEVHHLTPVSQIGEGYLVDPIKDLVPLCANCHAVVHRRNPPLTVLELQALIESHLKRRQPVP